MDSLFRQVHNTALVRRKPDCQDNSQGLTVRLSSTGIDFETTGQQGMSTK